MAIYRGFKPWWLFVGLFGNSVGLDASNFSSQRQFMEAAMPQATFIYGAGSPAMGIAATYRGDDYYVRFGLYGEPSLDSTSEILVITGNCLTSDLTSLSELKPPPSPGQLHPVQSHE